MHKKKKSVWKKILWLIRPYLHFLMLSFVFAGISALLTLYAPILIGNAVDLIIGKGSVDFDAIGRILFRLAGIIVITSAAQWLMNLCKAAEASSEICRQPCIWRDHQSDHHRCGAVFGWTPHGIYSVLYRCGDDFGNPGIYAPDQCEDCVGCNPDHAGIFVCGKLYCEENLCVF